MTAAIFTMSLTLMADSSRAIAAMREYVTPTMTTLTALAGIFIKQLDRLARRT